MLQQFTIFRHRFAAGVRLLTPKNHREQLLDSWLALMEDAPAPEGPLRLPVLSGSMVPDIPVGSMAHIEKATARQCRPGQVIVYRDKDRLVVHRVLLRLGWGAFLLFYEKGDANSTGGWIKSNQIKGLVVAVGLLNEEGPQKLLPNPKRARASLGDDLRYRILFIPRRIKSLLWGSHN